MSCSFATIIVLLFLKYLEKNKNGVSFCMVLHIFNPSHDEALAANYPYYYPSGISREKAELWGALPAIWAKEGDIVWLSGNPSELLLKEWKERWGESVRFVRQQEFSPGLWKEVDCIDPWGWDLLLRHQLKKAGAPSRLLPSDEQLSTLRQLSGRSTSAAILPLLRERLEREKIPTIGQSVVITDNVGANRLFHVWNGGVVKSLWSCSGRGLFYVERQPCEAVIRRIQRLLDKQGGVEIEPRYVPAATFAIEFFADKEKGVRYLGASLFRSGTSGAYFGNVISSQSDIWAYLGEKGLAETWIKPLLNACIDVANDYLDGRYHGPLGIDMMMVRSEYGARLFPCMEMNLRRTMGHVALEMARRGLHISQLPQNMTALWTTADAL